MPTLTHRERATINEINRERILKADLELTPSLLRSLGLSPPLPANRGLIRLSA